MPIASISQRSKSPVFASAFAAKSPLFRAMIRRVVVVFSCMTLLVTTGVDASSRSGPLGVQGGKHYGPGEKDTIPYNWAVTGDVIVQGTQLFDNNASTGLAVLCELPSGCAMEFPYGGTSDSLDLNAFEVVASGLLRDGCVGGCASVKLVWWTGRVKAERWISEPIVTGGDPLRKDQWWIQKIQAASGWTDTRGRSDIQIAVIDTGVDYLHVDLSGSKTNTTDDRDFINNDADAMDDSRHGTHVAGIAAAITDNSQGVSGVCPECTILPIKVLDAAGSGSSTGVANGIRYAADMGAEVINLSLGADQCAPDMAAAVNYAYDKNVVLVAAAGNSGAGECPFVVAIGTGSTSMGYPGALNRVLAVGASDEGDARAAFSSTGPMLDVSAPGVRILSTLPSNRYGVLDGTSMSAPMVAGLAALVIAKNGQLHPSQVEAIIRSSADDLGDPGRDDQTGWGRINVARALHTGWPAVASEPEASCPSTMSAQERTDDADLLDLYRAIRDSVFSTSTLGREYTAQYYTYGPEVSRILFENPPLRSDLAALLHDAENEFQMLLPGAADSAVLSEALVRRTESLIHGVAEKSSPQLKDGLLTEWQRLDLASHVGQSTARVWQAISDPDRNYVRIYIPVGSK